MPTHEDDTHEDFKPKFNPEAEPRTATTVEDQIKQDITDNSVFLYMKVSCLALHAVEIDPSWRAQCTETYCGVQGVPEAPQCGFSNMACRILDAYGERP